MKPMPSDSTSYYVTYFLDFFWHTTLKVCTPHHSLISNQLSSTTCEPTQLRHLNAFSVLSCFLCNEVCIAPYSPWTNVTFIIQDLEPEGWGICGTLSGITDWTVCCMVCRLSAASRGAEQEDPCPLADANLEWEAWYSVWADLRARQLHLSVHMCVVDKDIFKIVLLTARQLLLDVADTSPCGILSNKAVLWNIFHY